MSKVLDWIYEQKWAIEPTALQAIIEVVEKRMEADFDPAIFHKREIENIQALQSQYGEPIEDARYAVAHGKVAVIPIVGALFPRASLLQMSSGMSISTIAKDFRVALENDLIESIIFNIDSPGGEITGISELSDLIFSSQEKKTILSYVYGHAASAAYWIGSSAMEIIMSKTGEVGSIGVVASWSDTKERDKKIGIVRREIVSSTSPQKRLDLDSDEGKSVIQKIVDELADIFIGAIARNRGTEAQDILDNYGRGGMLVGESAIKANMADRILSLDGLIEEQNNKQLVVKQFSIGGEVMDYETLKADYKDLFVKVFGEGKVAGLQEGTEKENARIKAIEEIESPEAKEIIANCKFDTKETKESISSKVLEAQEKIRKTKAEEHKEDGEKANTQSKGIKQDETADDDTAERKIMAKNIANGANK